MKKERNEGIKMKAKQSKAKENKGKKREKAIKKEKITDNDTYKSQQPH